MAAAVGNEAILELQKALTNPEATIDKRYRSLFTLRNIGGQKAIDAMAEGNLTPLLPWLFLCMNWFSHRG